MNKRFILFVLLYLNICANLYAETSNDHQIHRPSTDIKYMYWVSDIHVDKYYNPGSPDKCFVGTSSGMKCCRKYDIAEKG